MNNLERVKKTLKHQKVDRVPFFELVLNSNVFKDIFSREGIICNASGQTRLSFFKTLFGSLDGKFYLSDFKSKLDKKIEEFMLSAIGNIINLYQKLDIEMVPFRPYDFLISPFYRIYLGFSENIYNIKIEINKNRDETLEWKIENSENFWSRYRFEEKQDTVFMINDCIKEKGEKELKRFVKYLRKAIPVKVNNNCDFLDSSRFQYKTASKYYKKVMELKSKNKNNFFSVGYASIPYPSNATFHPIFLELMITNPSLINDYFETTIQEVLNLARVQILEGVDAIIDVTDWCYNSGPMFSPSFMKNFIVPYLKKVVNLCHDNGVYYIKHLDGNTNSILPILVEDVEIDGLHGIESSAGVNIKDIKKRYGNNITLIGNVDCSKLLIFGTKEEIFSEVKYLIENVSINGGHILSSSNSIHSGVPTVNLLHMLEARDMYGKL